MNATICTKLASKTPPDAVKVGTVDVVLTGGTRERTVKPDDANPLNWAITFFLIAIVAVVFSFVGTGSETASLVGCIAAFCFLVLALVMLAVYVYHRHQRLREG